MGSPTTLRGLAEHLGMSTQTMLSQLGLGGYVDHDQLLDPVALAEYHAVLTAGD